MRHDTARLHTQVGRALERLEADLENPVALWALVRTLFEPPLDGAVREIRQNHHPSRNIQQEIADLRREDLLELTRKVEADVQQALLSHPQLRWTEEHLRAVHDFLLEGRLTQAAESAQSVVNAIEPVTKPVEQRPFTSTLMPREGFEKVENASVSARALLEQTKSAVARAREWTRLASGFDHAEKIDRLERAGQFIAEVLRGEKPATSDPPKRTEEFLRAAIRLTREVLDELALRPLLHQSVLRLRVHLESFVREELLEGMQQSPKKKDPASRKRTSTSAMSASSRSSHFPEIQKGCDRGL